jgi:hypothetical protein
MGLLLLRTLNSCAVANQQHTVKLLEIPRSDALARYGRGPCRDASVRVARPVNNPREQVAANSLDPLEKAYWARGHGHLTHRSAFTYLSHFFIHDKVFCDVQKSVASLPVLGIQ